MADDVSDTTLIADCNHTLLYKIHVMSIYLTLFSQLSIWVCVYMYIRTHKHVYKYAHTVCTVYVYTYGTGYSICVYLHSINKHRCADVYRCTLDVYMYIHAAQYNSRRFNMFYDSLSFHWMSPNTKTELLQGHWYPTQGPCFASLLPCGSVNGPHRAHWSL